MKTLILTCNTGYGHNSCAASIKEYCLANGDSCEIVDALSFLSKQASKFVDKCFTGIYRHIPKAFDSMYSFSDSEARTVNAMGSAVKVLKLGGKRLYKYITEGNFDSVVCVHLFPAIMVSWLKEKHNLSAKTAFLITDYTCYPFTEKTNVDLYFLPHADLINDFNKIVKDESKLVVTGIPVKKDFLALPDKDAAKKQLGLSDYEKVVFIMGGSMGCGPMEELVCTLSKNIDPDTKILVACGTNKTLLKDLQKKNLYNTDVFSFSDNIPTVMAATDLFISKPGGISSTEAAVSGLPSMVMNVIGACETPNYNFFVNRNYFYGGASVDEASDACIALLKKPEELKARSKLLKEVFHKNSAKEIHDVLAHSLGEI